MYVNPFWFGVLMTLLAEVIFCIVYAALTQHNRGKK